ncbi:MAG: hypothetical protein ACLU8J_12030 [Acutalibacter sp.]
MADFFTAALPFIAIGLAIALLAANARRGRERKNYLTEGMCLGLALGAGLSGLLQWSWAGHVWAFCWGRLWASWYQGRSRQTEEKNRIMRRLTHFL